LTREIPPFPVPQSAATPNGSGVAAVAADTQPPKCPAHGALSSPPSPVGHHMSPSAATLIDHAIEQSAAATRAAAIPAFAPLLPQRLRRLTASLKQLRSLSPPEPPPPATDKPDPTTTRLEWEGFVGRRAITIATVQRLRDALTDLAADLPAGGYAHRVQPLLPWVDRLAEIARLPADPTCDYAANLTGDVVPLRPRTASSEAPPKGG